MPDSVKGMLTEQVSSRYEDLDSWSSAEMIAAMYEGQLAAAIASSAGRTEAAAASWPSYMAAIISPEDQESRSS